MNINHLLFTKTCHYCDDIKYDFVCYNCYSDLIHHTDAIKKYGLTKNQLSKIFSVKLDYYQGYSAKYCKYSEDDLYDLQDKLIKVIPKTDKQYKKLIKHKKNIDDAKQNKQKYLKKKIDIQNLLVDLFKKYDEKYIKMYATTISYLVSQYSDSDASCTSIAFQICEIIEENIRNEQNKIV
jgi:hypothetical protein